MNEKNTIRLTESDLKRVISESVKKVLKEYAEGNEISSIPGENYDPQPKRLVQTIIDESEYILNNILPQAYASAVKANNKELHKYLSNIGQELDVILDRAQDLQNMVTDDAEEFM